MDADLPTIAIHLVGALLAGGIIGIERSFHGRPAGFRTHALVGLASSVLMVLVMFQGKWTPAIPFSPDRTDPTRMAQGIMTGIGFLGAGVIFKEGLTVRGLTTAASIWVTAAIGILIGVGFYSAAILATLLTLLTLSFFRWIEIRLPTHNYAQHMVRFERGRTMPEAQMKEFLKSNGFRIAKMTYQGSDDGVSFEYLMTIWTINPDNLARLAAALRENSDVRAFRIAPTGD
jgi:putative Mg2+ transporter-C (MgtC) family protein